MKTNVWGKNSAVLVLILLALWLAKIDRYSFTPDTKFTTITGETITLKALQGKPVLITFWATSCGICIKEIPDLLALYRQFHPQGLEIIAIAMAYDPPNRVVAMARERNLPYPVVLDLASEYANSFGQIWGTPSTFLIDPKGAVAKRTIGSFNLADMQSRIQQLLKG
jgi:peroxiredoxin